MHKCWINLLFFYKKNTTVFFLVLSFLNLINFFIYSESFTFIPKKLNLKINFFKRQIVNLEKLKNIIFVNKCKITIFFYFCSFQVK